jgi:hypothetical protein
MDGARFIVVGNASISALAFTEGYSAALMAVNWTRAPHWLVSPGQAAATVQASPTGDKLAQRDGRPVAEDEPETGAPSGVIM